MAGKRFYSKNAVGCYEKGIIPLWCWSKRAILVSIGNSYGSDAVLKARTHTLSFLRESFLVYDSWHHMGIDYKCVDFYRFVGDMDIDRAIRILDEQEVVGPAIQPVPFPVRASWIEYRGHGEEAKAYKVIAFGRIVGDSFYDTKGQRRLISSKSFSYRRLGDEAAKNLYKKAFGVNSLKGYRRWLRTGR